MLLAVSADVLLRSSLLGSCTLEFVCAGVDALREGLLPDTCWLLEIGSVGESALGGLLGDALHGCLSPGSCNWLATARRVMRGERKRGSNVVDSLSSTCSQKMDHEKSVS